MKILTLSILFAASAFAGDYDTPFSDLRRRMEKDQLERKIEEIQAGPDYFERQRIEAALEKKITKIIEDREYYDRFSQ